MKVKCIEVFVQPGSSSLVNGIKRGTRNTDGFKNLSHGMGLMSFKAEVSLFAKKNGVPVSIPIAKEFRKKFAQPGKGYAQLTKKRLEKIIATMPIEVELSESGEISQQSIDEWFATIR